MKNRWIAFFFLVLIFTISFLLRIWGLWNNHPFWGDEFFTASQAKVVLKYGLSVFNNPAIYFEYHNIIPHFLVAGFFKVFGFHEWSARLPFVIIGSLVPVAVFVFARRFFDLSTAASASLLTTFSYFEIVWSRQARGYVLQQLLILLIFYFYLKLVNKKQKTVIDLSILAIVLLIGILTHSLFYLVILALLIHLILFNSKLIIVTVRNKWSYFFLLFLIMVSYKTGFLKTLMNFYKLGFLGTNNLWYYHSFLWREYGLITFLSLMGFALGFLKNRRVTSLILIYLLIHLSFLLFVFKPYISRYILPIFPLLFIGLSYALTNFVSLLGQRKNHIKLITSTLVTLFIIANGYKFVTKPQAYHSVNHDFREISNIDYHQFYKLIANGIHSTNEKIAIIETLPDRASWYLGEGYQPLFLFRWGETEGFVNGLAKRTPFSFNAKGEKVVSFTTLRLITEFSDLKKIMTKHPKGFIFIDDSSLPRDVIDYAEKHFKKELYLDHYPLDDNPYSVWPATLYSWGITDKEKESTKK